MNRLSVLVAIAVGVVATSPALAQQNQANAPPAAERETVPLKLKAKQVMDIQQTLNERGFSSGPVDGLWGPRTSSAVKQFQVRNGLRASGEVDRKTLSALGVAGDVNGSAAQPTAPSARDAESCNGRHGSGHPAAGPERCAGGSSGQRRGHNQAPLPKRGSDSSGCCNGRHCGGNCAPLR